MSTMREVLANRDASLGYSLGDYEGAVQAQVARLEALGAARRIWDRDGSLWSANAKAIAEIEDRLGWLDLPETMPAEFARLRAFAAETRGAFDRVVLLGMGGSSLAPEVMRLILGIAPNCPELVVLDATDPAQIRRAAKGVALSRMLFLVSSKSGTTIEPLSLYLYFKDALKREVGASWARQMVAITDPNTRLSKMARDEGWRETFLNPPDIGGRYSALSLFGLVPAALLGHDLDRLLQRAREVAASCRATQPAERNAGLVLGALMGALAVHPTAPRDKLTLLTSRELAPFGPWAEQLIAESTGKEGMGILPVEGEDADHIPPSADRWYAYLRLEGANNADLDARAIALAEAGQPVVAIKLRDVYDLGAEFYRWEFATAVAGQVLGINTFDQPNVESAKEQARRALARYEQAKALPEEAPLCQEQPLALYGHCPHPKSCVADCLGRFFGQAQPGRYLAIMAYIDRAEAHEALLQALRMHLERALGIAVTVGFGPRFLHSTGQLHKGDGNKGLFLQLTQDETDDLPIPERTYTFGVLKKAQALGDLEALRGAGRAALRINLGADVRDGLETLLDRVRAALAG